ncbi:MAG: hypothetical protein ACUVQY_04135 [Thermoproteota archaeon]
MNRKCKHKYDCVWSDNFDEISTFEYLKTAAGGICTVLNPNGKFVFSILAKPGRNLKGIIEEEWRRRKRFCIRQPYGRSSLRVTHIEVAEKTRRHP